MSNRVFSTQIKCVCLPNGGSPLMAWKRCEPAQSNKIKVIMPSLPGVSRTRTKCVPKEQSVIETAGEIMTPKIHGAITKFCLQIFASCEIIYTEETGCTLNQRLREHKTCNIVVTRHIKSYWICDKYLCLSNFIILQTTFPGGWLKNTRTPYLSVLKSSSSQDL